MAGVIFDPTLGCELLKLPDAGRQAEILHEAFGLVSFSDELLEPGGTGPPQTVKSNLVGHGRDTPDFCVSDHT